MRDDLNVPGWIQYPHATPSTSGPKGVQITLRYQTVDSVENVAEYYKTEITQRGGRATAEPGVLERWGVHGIVVKDANGKLKVDIMKPERQATIIVINYWR